jgi:hypothetical protein
MYGLDYGRDLHTEASIAFLRLLQYCFNCVAIFSATVTYSGFEIGFITTLYDFSYFRLHLPHLQIYHRDVFAGVSKACLCTGNSRSYTVPVEIEPVSYCIETLYSFGPLSRQNYKCRF